jgi:PmbA protein
LYLTECSVGRQQRDGRFSQGASGYWIENGEMTYPVQESRSPATFSKSEKRAGDRSDLSFKLGSTASPTLLISEMTVGGE